MFANFQWPIAATPAEPPTLEVLEAKPSKHSARRETPLVFVHGGFVGAWCWHVHFLEYFAAQGFHAIAPSLRGHGQSGGRERLDHAGIREYVADLARVIDSLDGPPPVLVGHSMGALVVQRYLEQYPASGAVLMAPIPTQGLLGSTLRMAWSDPMLLTQYGLMQWMGGSSVNDDIARRAVFSKRLPAAQSARYRDHIQPESQRALWEMNVHPAGRPWLVERALPIQVLGAEEDALFTRAESEAVARLWQAPFESIPAVAHAMMLEPHWQYAADAIVRWLWSNAIR